MIVEDAADPATYGVTDVAADVVADITAYGAAVDATAGVAVPLIPPSPRSVVSDPGSTRPTPWMNSNSPLFSCESQ